jgi:hypothetical protein
MTRSKKKPSTKGSRARRRHITPKKDDKAAHVIQPKATIHGLLGLYKGRMEILGDIISPIDVEWEALK